MLENDEAIPVGADEEKEPVADGANTDDAADDAYAKGKGQPVRRTWSAAEDGKLKEVRRVVARACDWARPPRASLPATRRCRSGARMHAHALRMALAQLIRARVRTPARTDAPRCAAQVVGRLGAKQWALVAEHMGVARSRPRHARLALGARASAWRPA